MAIFQKKNCPPEPHGLRQLEDKPPDSFCDTFELHQFVQHAVSMRRFLNKRVITFGSSPTPHKQNSALIACFAVLATGLNLPDHESATQGCSRD